jgi:glycosyltransferase involved in cell wall biosynthesis
MNCFNSAQYLKEAIDSVYAQTYKDWEIIFWDNASTDNSPQIAQSYGEKLRYFRSQETVNIGKARNWALGKAQGKYIAFLDCDDLWLPDKLQRQVALFEENQDIGLAFSEAIIFDDEGRSYLFYGKKIPPQGMIFRELLKRNFIVLQAAMIRRNTLDSLKEWFDERFNVSEDADFFIRLAYRSKAMYLDEPLVKRRMHRESLTSRQAYLFPEEMELMLEKFFKLYDNFGKEFESEVSSAQAMIAYHYALADLEKGKRDSARRRLNPHLALAKRLWIIYLFSFLPFGLYRYLKGLYKITLFYKYNCFRMSI